MIDVDGVSIIGSGHWPGQVCRDASDMYSNNLLNLVNEYWDEEQKTLELALDDDILSGCVITHAGAIVNETIRKLYDA